MAAVSSRPPPGRRSRRGRRAAPAPAGQDTPRRVVLYRPSFRRRALRAVPRLLGRLAALGLLGACVWGVVTWGLAPLLDGSPPAPAVARPAPKAKVRHVLPPPNLVPGLTRSRVHGLPLSVLDASGRPGRLAAVVSDLRALGFARARTVVSRASAPRTLVAYAPGWRPQAEAVSQALGLPLQPRGAWLGPLQHAKLVLVLGRGAR